MGANQRQAIRAHWSFGTCNAATAELADSGTTSTPSPDGTHLVTEYGNEMRILDPAMGGIVIGYGSLTQPDAYRRVTRAP
jgi:hypothetical protein